ncbi:MAG: hypothetical protein E6Q66_05980 [Pedobacter sp.]|nr:MAG: hypothetical protein E6Q66_05980 [Pedobacter sp.]
MSKIIHRIKQAIDFKGIGVREFCNMIGVSHGFLTKEREIGNEKVSKIIDILPEIDPIWLLTGKGEMLATAQKKEGNTYATPSMKPKEGIPLLPIEALANMDSEDILILQYDCEYFVIPTFKGADFLIAVRGESMSPKYNNGDIVACQKLPLDSFFQWNHIYMLYTEQGPLIKRVKKSGKEGYISVVSDNLDYEPFELARNHIKLLAIVLGVIHLE